MTLQWRYQFLILFLNNKKNKSDKVKIKLLNNLNFNKVNLKRYPMIKILDNLPNKHYYETAIVSANDALVDLFLKKKN